MRFRFAQDYPSLTAFELNALDFVINLRKKILRVRFLAKPFSMKVSVDAAHYPRLIVSTKNSFQELRLLHSHVQTRIACPKCKNTIKTVYLRKTWTCNACAGLTNKLSVKQEERDHEEFKKCAYQFAPGLDIRGTCPTS